MKHQADKGRTERQFNVGDLVFLKIQPYVQSSLEPMSNQKLAFKFYGTYVVSEEYEVVQACRFSWKGGCHEPCYWRH
jgi:hypothetical protein